MEFFNMRDAMPATSISPASAGFAPVRHRGRPRPESLPGRRQLLLDTARQLFVEHGFLEASLTDIARSAHVALRTIYSQYGGKQGLLRELIREEHALHERELGALQLKEKNFRDQMESLALHVTSRISRPDLLRLYTIVQASSNPALVESFSLAGPGQVCATLDILLRRRFGSTPVHGMHSIESLCDHFIACITPARMTVALQPEAVTDHARRGLDLFLRVLPVEQAVRACS
jgi:TetR/AcrR family transcriptional repressor of mexJK operon